MSAKRRNPVSRRIHAIYRTCANDEAGEVLFEDALIWTDSEADAVKIANESAAKALNVVQSDSETIAATDGLVAGSGYTWTVIAFAFPMRAKESPQAAQERMLSELSERIRADWDGAVEYLISSTTHFAGGRLDPAVYEGKQFDERRIALREAVNDLLEWW